MIESNEYQIEFITNNHGNYNLLCDGYAYLKKQTCWEQGKQVAILDVLTENIAIRQSV
jgi:hypothetical protein